MCVCVCVTVVSGQLRQFVGHPAACLGRVALELRTRTSPPESLAPRRCRFVQLGGGIQTFSTFKIPVGRSEETLPVNQKPYP